MLEKELEKKLRVMIKEMGGRAYKFVSPGNSGVPDRIVIIPMNRIYFVEMKKPGETTTKLQKVQISRLRRLGCKAFVIDNEEDLKKFKKEIMSDVSKQTNIKST